jgi:L-alanine-DL-glutamate epimerase-like enolase superfamily enzyme
MKSTVQELLGRRSFLKSLGVGAAGLGSARLWADAEPEAVLQRVNRNSIPSELKITDLRVAIVGGAPMTCPIIRIDTNQGISGYGEVRDGASKNYALFLKSRLLGENPCNVDKLFRKIKQFGHHGRQAGGVCGVEMALWDLAGKAYGVPVYQMLGGKFRDRVRLYADTTQSSKGEEAGQRLKARMDQGLTWLKIDLGISLLRGVPGTLNRPSDHPADPRGMLMHPFTGVEITDKGLATLADHVAAVRQVIGMEVPLAADHFGHIGVNSCIRLARALQPYQMAWLEDMVPWQFTELLKQITQSVEAPILTGEDIYLKEEFAKLVNQHAIDIIHPDLASSGGLLETKKIGDLAMEAGVPMAMHFAGTPVSFLANVHCAAATENFLCLEHHSLDVPWWEDLVQGLPKPLVRGGYATVPEGPGLGFELNEEVLKAHLKEPGCFEPTPEWDKERSWDRLWS